MLLGLITVILFQVRMFLNQTLSTPSTANPMKDVEVTSPPDDSISALAFSPATLPQNFLVAGSWDNNVSSHITLHHCKHTFFYPK